MKKHICKHIIFGIVAIVFFPTAIMLLWNWVVPAVFGLGTITICQAAGLFVLCRLLFGRIGCGGRRWGHHHGGGNHMRERWEQMTPEQRKEFVRKRHMMYGGKCKPSPCGGNTPQQDEQ